MNSEQVEKWWKETLDKLPKDIINEYSNIFGELEMIFKCQVTDRKLYQRRAEYYFNELEHIKKEVKKNV